MAYNRKNLLKKIINIQQITIEYEAKGVKKKWIFENLIQPNYNISYVTYYNYLNTNARKELSEMGEDWKTFIKKIQIQ
jgi:hypothetical protein